MITWNIWWYPNPGPWSLEAGLPGGDGAAGREKEGGGVRKRWCGAHREQGAIDLKNRSRLIHEYDICIYMYTYIHMYIYVYIYIHVYRCIYIQININVYICTCTYFCVYIYIFMCLYTYVYIYVCVYIHIYA